MMKYTKINILKMAVSRYKLQVISYKICIVFEPDPLVTCYLYLVT